MFVSISEAGTYLGCSISTLRRWDKEGKLPAQRTSGCHRRYNLESLKSTFGANNNASKITIGYARVSSSDQREGI